MLKKTIAILLLVLCFTSCTGNVYEESETRVSVTASQWRGLETIDHGATDSKTLGYLALWELTGTPDPPPPEGYVRPETDLENIICETEKEVYSLSDATIIYVNVTYVQTEENQNNTVELDHFVNVERWNGESWDRLINFDPEWFLNTSATKPHFIKSGGSHHEALTLATLMTALTPGKYRLVTYINYLPVYAEFEFVE